MITVRLAEDRGIFKNGWLDTRHTFSFGNYVDRTHHHFRALRVINEDRIQPGQGFETHPHRDMEILTWVLSGTLAHHDSDYHDGLLGPGDAQRMSAGIGIEHSEKNTSATEVCHMLQIWLFPKETGGPPSYEHRHFPEGERHNRMRLIASPDGAEESLHWQQDARLYSSLLDAGCTVRLEMPADRHGWVHVARGRVLLNGLPLKAGDGAAIADERQLEFEAEKDSEVMVFDLA